MTAAVSTDTKEKSFPTHIAIIMDGNGRWAKKRGLPRIAGHKRGAEVVREIVTACRDQGVRYLSLYAFSSENWKRPKNEVISLMGLLRIYLRREISKLNKKGVRLVCIGNRDELDEDIQKLMREAEEKTKDNTVLQLNICVNYGSQNEILNACKALAQKCVDGELTPSDINQEIFEQNLLTAGIPHPDLIIRTSGEQRLSNFLMWQASYSELMFTDLYWPEFTPETLANAIDDYMGRERRYGAV